MAIYSNNMLKGNAGPFTFREVKKQQIVSRRLKKGEMKQTKATKDAASTFGMASKLGKHLRQTLKTSLGELYDSSMSTRMTTEIKDILFRCRDSKTRSYSFEEQSFSALNNFDYNLKSPLSKSVAGKITVAMADGILTVNLSTVKPSEMFRFPARSSACEVVIGISLFRLSDGLKVFAQEIQSFSVEKKSSVIGIHDFEFKAPNGCLCVVNLFLNYYDVLRDLSIIVNSKTFSPAGICAALITPGLYMGKDKRSWVSMPDLKFEEKKLDGDL